MPIVGIMGGTVASSLHIQAYLYSVHQPQIAQDWSTVVIFSDVHN